MEQKAEILMKYFRENKSQRDISKELKISRTTVSKYIDEFESKYMSLDDLTKNEASNRSEILQLIGEMSSPPKYDTSKRKRIKLTDAVVEEIDHLISINEKNRQLGRSKQLMKKIDIHEYLLDKGYDIGYTTVCNYIKDSYDKKEAFVRQTYDLGDTLEFDWGDVKLTIAGKPMTLNMGIGLATLFWTKIYLT